MLVVHVILKSSLSRIRESGAMAANTRGGGETAKPIPRPFAGACPVARAHAPAPHQSVRHRDPFRLSSLRDQIPGTLPAPRTSTAPQPGFTRICRSLPNRAHPAFFRTRWELSGDQSVIDVQQTDLDRDFRGLFAMNDPAPDIQARAPRIRQDAGPGPSGRFPSETGPNRKGVEALRGTLAMSLAQGAGS